MKSGSLGAELSLLIATSHQHVLRGKQQHVLLADGNLRDPTGRVQSELKPTRPPMHEVRAQDSQAMGDWRLGRLETVGEQHKVVYMGMALE